MFVISMNIIDRQSQSPTKEAENAGNSSLGLFQTWDLVPAVT